MPRKLDVTGYLIVQLESQLSLLEALRELFENTLDANATNVDIKITSRSMTITDNGDGTDDPNLLVTPSASMSRFKAGGVIGSKGAGAKQAMAAFGRIWDIHTVPRGKGRYHRYTVRWDENGPLPNQYNRRSSLPGHAAPAAIRNGGTQIIVTGRQDGVSRVRIDTLRRELEETYRPALSGSGLMVNVSDPEKGEKRKLTNSAFDLTKFTGPVLVISDEADGRPFDVRYGALRAGDSILSGCHFIFGPRIVQTVGEIGSLPLPSGCYIDVTLGDKWKTLLGTNKNRFRHRDALTARLVELLAPWIEKQAAEARSFKMNLLAGRAAAMVNETISFLDKANEGDSRTKPREKPTTPRPVSSAPRTNIRTRHTEATMGGDLGIRKEETKRCLTLEIQPDDKLGRLLYRVSIVPGKVVVKLNSGEGQRTISELLSRGKNTEAEIHKIGVMAYAHVAADNKADPSFLPLWAALRKFDYEIDENSDRADIVSMLSNFLIDDMTGQRKRQTGVEVA